MSKSQLFASLEWVILEVEVKISELSNLQQNHSRTFNNKKKALTKNHKLFTGCRQLNLV